MTSQKLNLFQMHHGRYAKATQTLMLSLSYLLLLSIWQWNNTLMLPDIIVLLQGYLPEGACIYIYRPSTPNLTPGSFWY